MRDRECVLPSMVGHQYGRMCEMPNDIIERFVVGEASMSTAKDHEYECFYKWQFFKGSGLVWSKWMKWMKWTKILPILKTKRASHKKKREGKGEKINK